MPRDFRTQTPPRTDLVVTGDVVGPAIEPLRRDVEAAIAAGERRVIVDVSAAGCFDAAAYGFLLNTARRLAREGGWLKLLSGGPGKRLVDPEIVDRAAACTPEGGALWIEDDALVAV